MSDARTIDASGPDVESAISKGVTQLGVSRNDVIVEVLEEPSRGLLGIGARQAQVRLTVIRAPAAPPPAPSTPSAPAMPAPKAPSPAQEKQEREKPADRPIDGPAKSAEAKSNAPVRSAPAGGRRAPLGSHEDIDENWAEEGVLSDEELAEDARVGAETLQELLGYLQVDAKVIAKRAKAEDGEAQHFMLEIQGRELGALIGRRGETLAALQYITRLIASRDLERRARIVIDVEGYKSRREAQLRRMAKRIAEQAVQSGRTVSLEPMPPHERRIIHLALRDNPNVTTESVGEGDRRKVTVVPKREHSE